MSDGGAAAKGLEATVEMKVAQLTVDPFTNLPLVVLRDEAGHEAVTISVGVAEASAIACELEKIPLQRPMTHDLMKALLVECGAKVQRVEIRDVDATTHYAAIVLVLPHGGSTRVEARPSDAIALALRTGAPIRVARKVVDQAQLPPGSPLNDGDPLDGLPDEDFGKWKM